MSTANAYVQMTTTEARLVFRDVGGVVLPLGIPILLMTMHGMTGEGGQALDQYEGLSALSAIYAPSSLIMVLAILGLVNVPTFLTGYRHEGVLRRLSVTPINPMVVLAAQVVVNLLLAAVGIAFALVFGMLVYDIEAPRHIPWALLALLLSAGAMYAVGLLIAAVAPSVNSAMAIGLALFLGSLAIGGGLLPAEHMPELAARIGEFTPFGAGLAALRETWLGNMPSVTHLLVLVGYTVLGTAGAARLFRWQ